MQELPEWLAYGHPAVMALALGVAGLALRHGLKLRKARQGQAKRDAADRARHLLLGKIAVSLISVGIVGGPLTMQFVRGEPVFRSFHAWISTGVVILFIATAIVGRKLEHGERSVLELHAKLGILAVLAAAMAAVAGFILLP